MTARQIETGVLATLVTAALLASPFAASAPATVSTLTVSIATDGSAPFDELDSGPNNGIVRTNDRLTYQVTTSYSALGDVTFSSTLPAGMEWDPAASATSICTLGGSVSADRRTWTCSRTATALSETFLVSAWAYSIGNGTQIEPTITAGTATATAPITSIAGQPRMEMRSYFFAPGLNQNVNGVSGATWVFSYFWGATSATRNFRGIEALGSPLTFTLEVPPGAIITSRSPGNGGGTVATAQGAPGDPVTVTHTGGRTDFRNALTDGSVPTSYHYVLKGTLTVFIPYDPAIPPGQITTINLRQRGFDPVSLSGQSNFGAGFAPGQEPGYTCPAGASLLAGQVACARSVIDRTVTLAVNGTNAGASVGAQMLLGDAHTFPQGWEKVVPGQSFQANTGLYNAANASQTATGARECVTFDSAKLTLKSAPLPVQVIGVADPHNAFYNGKGTPIPPESAVVQYAAVGFADDNARRSHDCGIPGDGAPGWVSDPAALPGGLASVDAVRMSTTVALNPGTALGLRVPFARTTTATSAGLPTDTPLPWFVQFATDQTPLRKSTYNPGPSVRGDGGYVQAVRSLVRTTVNWSTPSVSPGEVSTVELHPSVIGPVGTGPDTSATNITLGITMNSTCHEPVESSFDALVSAGLIESYTLTPGDPGSDGIPCTGDDGPPAKAVVSLGDAEAPSGAAGGAFHPNVGGHQSDLPVLPISVVHSVLTPSGTTHLVTARISADTDTSRENWTGAPNAAASSVDMDRTVEASTVVSGVAAFTAQKGASTAVDGQLAPGETFSYTVTWGNGTSNNTGRGTFVDVLPYNGDPRGTTGILTPLAIVSATATTANPAVMGDVTVQWTQDSPATVRSALDLVGNENGNTGISWSGGTVPATATALRFITGSPVSPGYAGSATVTLRAGALGTRGHVVNDMYGRTEAVDGKPSSSTSFRAASQVALTSSAASLAGSVRRDLDFSGVASGADAPWPSGTARLEIADTASGTVVTTADIAADGSYSVPSILPGTYTVSLADTEATGWTRLDPQPFTATAGTDLTGANALYQEVLAAPVLVDDSGTAAQSRSTTIPILSNDSLPVPQAPGSIVPTDTTAITQAPTYGTGVLNPQAGDPTGSQLTYTAAALWPVEFAAQSRYIDSLTYSWTTASGLSASATVRVTVVRAPVAGDDTATVPDQASTVVVLGNDVGDTLTITDADVSTGDAEVTVENGALRVVPSHTWATTETSHEVVLRYTVTDSIGQEATASVTVTVVRPPVVAGPQTDRIPVDGLIPFDVQVLSPADLAGPATVTVPPSAGIVRLGEDEVVFDASGIPAGEYTVTVTWTDRVAQSTSVDYVVFVQAGPDGQGRRVTTTLGTQDLHVNPMSDAVGTGLQPLRDADLTQPDHGTVRVLSPGFGVQARSADSAAVISGSTLTAAGTVVYTLEPDYVGSTSFTATVTDDLGQSTVLTYTIEIVRSTEPGPNPGPGIGVGVPSGPDADAVPAPGALGSVLPVTGGRFPMEAFLAAALVLAGLAARGVRRDRALR